MAIDLHNSIPIDFKDQQYTPMLQRLQGNILKGHGREYGVYLFVTFTASQEEIRCGLAALAKRYVVSAWQQHVETQQFRHFKIPGGLFGNLLLTSRGYRALGFTDEQIAEAFTEESDDISRLKSNFKEGMAAHSQELGDPAPDQWEQGYKNSQIDAMLLLADDDENHLLRRAREATNEIALFSTIVAVERGVALRNEQGEGIEHFGYVDGRSQPIFLASDLDREGDIDKWNPFAPLELALTVDKLAQDESAMGSYFVFRKLEQDVLHFKLREQELADQLGLVQQDRRRAGAMVVGRFEDGTPLALYPTDGAIPAKENNFKYDIDPDGLRCPFHAHIRKTNPRGDSARKRDPAETEDIAERPRRIARRGITYGTRKYNASASRPLEALPTKDVGLLFMCFQRSIVNQFAFMQASWANSERFVLRAGTATDPVIGQESGQVTPKWPVAWGEATTKPFDFKRFVTMRGGEFFFAPSLTFFQTLGDPATANFHSFARE